MSGELIDFRLPNIGADFDENELLAFLNSSDSSVHIDRLHSACGDYLIAETEDGMQLWFQVDSEDKYCVGTFDVHFKSPTRMKLRIEKWTDQKDGGLFGLAYMWNDAGETEFPLNIDIVDAGLFADYVSGEFTAQVAAFGSDISLFPNIDAFRAAETGYSTESCIPIGTLPMDDNARAWHPSAYAILTGTIKSVKRAMNAYTGGEYYHLLIECIGLKLDALLRTEDVKSEPIVGGFIHGTFYLTARLFPSVGDECLTPCCAFETKEIIDAFEAMQFRENICDEPIDGWELLAYPIMADKSILLVFQNTSRVEAGNEKNSPFYYRILKYGLNGDIIEQRKTRLIGGIIATAFYSDDGHLHIVFNPVDDEEEYVFDIDDGLEPHPIRSLGEDISRLVADSKGNIFVGRDYSCYLEWSGDIISIYHVNDGRISDFHDECYRCSELYLDENENAWYYTEPISSLNRIVTGEDGSLHSIKENFPLSRILAIAISKNGEKLFCECEAVSNRSRFYVLTRKNGQYGSPVELRLPLVIQERCKTYGMCATAKDEILFNVDGVLYLFKLEDARCDTLKDLGRIRLKRRDSSGGHFYSVEIDAAEIVSDKEFDYYVEPIIKNLQDVAGESLTIAYSQVRKPDSLSYIQVARNGKDYHLEIAVADSCIDSTPRIYALLDADFDTVYNVFKTVVVECDCPNLSEWVDYTDTVFKNPKNDDFLRKNPFEGRNTEQQHSQVSLDSPISVLQLSMRSYNRLVENGILTVGQLVDCPVQKLKGIKGIGRKCLSEIKFSLAEHGFGLSQ